MDKRDEFKRLIDDILEEILNERGKLQESKEDLSPIPKTVIDILINLNGQIAEQEKNIDRLEEKIEKNEHYFKLLVEELKKEGNIRLRERRHLLRRAILSNEALINLLSRGRFINKIELRSEIKRLNKVQSKVE
jgi:polyhydroxyalkanoate synthesis regulator phasin